MFTSCSSECAQKLRRGRPDTFFAFWQRIARPFAGLVFGNQLHGSIGQYIRNLELIAKATDPADWLEQVKQMPLRKTLAVSVFLVSTLYLP